MVGHDLFYSVVGELDRDNTVGWFEMIEVQRTFKDAESGYGQGARTYSESMRLTLHWSLAYTFENVTRLREARASDGGLYGYFIRLHPTAFRANGACSLNPIDMARVMFNTNGSMMNATNIGWIAKGVGQRYEEAIRAARTVRDDRRRQGLPVTRDGYEQRVRVAPVFPPGYVPFMGGM